MTTPDEFWETLPERYRLILCDVWGVIHDGKRAYAGAVQRLMQWRGEGRQVVLVTNAPRPAEAVIAHLRRVGVPDDAWDAIASSGEAGIDALVTLGEPVGFVGTDSDRDLLEARGIKIDDRGGAMHVVCTGFDMDRLDPDSYRGELESMVARGATMHCLNPDRVVGYGGTLYPCAGALADSYEGLGGPVCWYGKPYRLIYDYALAHGGNPAADAVLAIGDSLQTDMAGAQAMGFDCVFVTGGIHADEPVEQLAAEHGLDGWRPLAMVDRLA
jgi:HAD superfamily hydrolase (TIGR01459 family)